jgi:hypothetical protein
MTTNEQKNVAEVELANAHWYRILALIATTGGWSIWRRPQGGSSVRRLGWRLRAPYRHRLWCWPGGVDPCGVPVAPPQEMLEQITQELSKPI